MQSHLDEKCTGKAKWVAELRLQGLRPIIIPIGSIVGTRAQAERREREWVWEMLRQGYTLFNKNYIPGDPDDFAEFLRNYQGPTKIYLSQEADASISA